VSDGLIPRCLACGEPVELAEHFERLDAQQGFIEWLRENLPRARFGVMPWCGECQRDPERRWALLAGLPAEEIRARFKALAERTGPEAL
jgi:hypothetical protein